MNRSLPAACASMELCDTENVMLYRDWSRSKAWLLNMFHEVVMKLSSTGTDTQHQVHGCLSFAFVSE